MERELDFTLSELGGLDHPPRMREMPTISFQNTQSSAGSKVISELKLNWLIDKYQTSTDLAVWPGRAVYPPEAVSHNPCVRKAP